MSQAFQHVHHIVTQQEFFQVDSDNILEYCQSGSYIARVVLTNKDVGLQDKHLIILYRHRL